MKPSVAFGILFLLAISLVTVYMVLLPNNMRENQFAKNKEGYWGIPTAEFDWCESNYNWVSFMAEPWNTVTGLSYIMVGAATIPYYLRLSHAHDIDLSMYLYLLFTLFVVGFPTTVFHATLQYEHQLLDKLAMYFMTSA